MRILFFNYVSNGPAFNSGIAALSGVLKSQNFDTFLINIYNDTTFADVQNEMMGIQPDIMGFSIHTPHWDHISEFIARIGEVSEATILCGGYHPTICPEEVINHPQVDIICRGEGETPILELVRRIDQKMAYSDIRGLWVKVKKGNHNQIIRNPIAFPSALDDLPYWDRDLFLDSGLSTSDFSLTHIGGFPIASGRGCPYRCAFCNNSSFLEMYSELNSQYVRKRSVQEIISECFFLIERYGASGFEFWDEMFAVDRKWVLDFCEEYKNKILKPFICAMRVERADALTLGSLKEAGCRSVFFGVETGNENYRKKYLNRKMSNDSIVSAFQNARNVGLERFAWVMFGLPDETPEMIEETIQFLIRIKPDIIGWSVYHPLPGTELFEYCRDKKYLNTQEITPYKGAPDYRVPVLNQPSLSVEQIEYFCDKFRDLETIGFKVNK